MIVMVINSGSSSLKFLLYRMETESLLARGIVEEIGKKNAMMTYERPGRSEISRSLAIPDHSVAIREVLTMITHQDYGVLKSVREIDAVGHRIVHGGDIFTRPVLVNEEVKREIRRLYGLAPLHNPAHMAGIEAVEANMPGTPQVLVFDTSFHWSMPRKAYLYPIPLEWYTKHRIRRYGFHGISHDYVSGRAAEWLGRPRETLKMVTCHIGNGASCTAIMGGKSVDTSMGMTPLEGLMMGTRSGDIDPAILAYVMEKEGLSADEVITILNKRGGLLAVAGDNDWRAIEKAMREGDERAALAFEMYEYRLRKCIGAYAAVMNGLDVLVFTAGIGENSALLRKRVCDQLTFFGIEIDDEANSNHAAGERIISTPNSKVAVLVIPTNEELMIARSACAMIGRQLRTVP